MKRFPRDCEKDCKYYHEYDMSVDDYTAQCFLLKAGCDLCDEEYCLLLCPLPECEEEND